MTKYIKLIISLAGCLVVCTLLMLMVFTTNPSVENKAYTDNTQKHVSNQSNETMYENVSTSNSETEKYILRYYPEKDMVMLITKKADGTEIMSPMESINPYYLTDDDIKALITGIELYEMEDVYILIEDLSS